MTDKGTGNQTLKLLFINNAIQKGLRLSRSLAGVRNGTNGTN